MKRFFVLISLMFLALSCQQLDKFLGIDIKKNVEKPNNKIVHVETAADTAQQENGNLLGWMRYPAVSPDGSEIAFAFMGDIYIVPAKGGFARALTSAPSHESRPVWANSGKTIAFVSSRFGNFDIFTISKNG